MAITDLILSIIYGAVLLFLLGAVATLWARMGNVQGELGGLKAEVAGLRTSVNERIDGLQATVDEMVKTQHEMQLQAQRNHYQMMMAILSHSHRVDGRINFDLPPDFEPTSASD